MKIPLRVGKLVSGQRSLYPILPTRLRKKRTPHSIFGKIQALIDTGSTATHISYKDMKLLKIPIERLPKSSIGRPIKIGGCSFNAKALKDVTMILTKEDGSPYIMKISEISVIGNPEKALDEKEKRHELIPSIIGTDFLDKHNFALYFNPSKKKAYLETED